MQEIGKTLVQRLDKHEKSVRTGHTPKKFVGRLKWGFKKQEAENVLEAMKTHKLDLHLALDYDKAYVFSISRDHMNTNIHRQLSHSRIVLRTAVTVRLLNDQRSASEESTFPPSTTFRG